MLAFEQEAVHVYLILIGWFCTFGMFPVVSGSCREIFFKRC